MTYYDSASDIEITRDRALQELAAHGCFDAESLANFDATLGVRELYNAQDVLKFLGH